MSRKPLAIIAATAALGAALAALALAQAAGALAGAAVFSILPVDGQPYFVAHLRPGETFSSRVKVTNVGGVAGTARLYAVDATTGQTSGAVYEPPEARRSGVGGWITLARRQLTLGPRQSAFVSFTVRVPSGAGPGQHLGGLVAAPALPVQTQVTRRGSRSFRVTVRELAIVAVLVDLPGPALQRLAITGVSASGRPGYQTLLVDLRNTGDELVRGSGTIAISRAGSSGLVLARNFRLDTFLPHTRIDYPLYLSRRRLAPGRYRAVFSLRYGDGRRLQRVLAFSISSAQLRRTYGTVSPLNVSARGSRSSWPLPPWALALAAIALVLIGFAAALALQRSRASSGAGRR
jgi:hypothetical protein